LAELFTRQGDDRCVNDRHHFIDVIEEESVKEDFVGVLKSSQVNVALQVIALSFEGSIRANDLLADVFDMRRKKTMETQISSLLVRKCRPFVQPWTVEEIRPAAKISNI